MANLNPISVTLDSYYGDPSAVFHGYTTGDDWNGFVTPFFDRAEADRISAWLDRVDDEMRVAWVEAADTFVVTEGDAAYPVATMADDDHGILYGVGAYSWTWVEADN